MNAEFSAECACGETQNSQKIPYSRKLSITALNDVIQPVLDNFAQGKKTAVCLMMGSLSAGLTQELWMRGYISIM